MRHKSYLLILYRLFTDLINVMCINDTFAGYSPWKFPPEMVSPLSANTIYSLLIKVKELPVLEAKLKKKLIVQIIMTWKFEYTERIQDYP